MTLDDPGPFRVRVYDKAFRFLFQLGGCAVSVTPRHLAKGSGSITVALGHPRFAALNAPGTRVTIDYLTSKDRTREASWTRVMSGPLWTKSIPDQAVPAAGKVCAFGVEDDIRVLWQMLGWANPAAAIGAQTANAYDVRSGNAETVIKGYVTANATRLGLPLTCAPNLGRGLFVKGSVRFDVLGDALMPLAQVGGVGVRVDQIGAGLVLDCYAPTDRTARVLTESSGAIRSWSLTTMGPNATRAVIAAQGEGTARNFSQVIDASLETTWATTVEVPVDARDTSDAATLAQRGAQALLDGAPQAGYSVTLAETPVVKYAQTMTVGDRIAVAVIPGLAISDVLSECTLSYTTADGFTVSPQVGFGTGSAAPARLLAQGITKALSGIRKLGSHL